MSSKISNNSRPHGFYELLLVSQSPRRRELLEKAGFTFRVDTVKISEITEENVKSTDLVTNIALAKAEAYLSEHKLLKGQRILVLAADTMVFIGDRALGKPSTPSEAEHFLRLLSGRTHEVITGMVIKNLATDETVTTSVTTKVRFRDLSDEEIRRYVETGESVDKAGGYAIQGEGQVFVSGIEGSYSNVVGLPMEELQRILTERGWEIGH